MQGVRSIGCWCALATGCLDQVPGYTVFHHQGDWLPLTTVFQTHPVSVAMVFALVLFPPLLFGSFLHADTHIHTSTVHGA